jgi:hypothetical protein
MKVKKNIPLAVVILLLFFSSNAQKTPSFYPFKGFHVGITGQAEYIQKCTYVALTGVEPAPRSRWTSGGEIGMEFSYHFAKYFGIAIGINYGTVLSYKRDQYISTLPLETGEFLEVNGYDRSFITMSDKEMLFPIKIEFHYPLRKDLFFTAEAGVKIKGIFQKLACLKYNYWEGSYGTGCNYSIYDDYDPEEDVWYTKPYYRDLGLRDMRTISCNLLLGIGLYYQLPYGDLLRFTTGINVSFNNIIEGYYRYYLTDSYGTFSVKNDFIYTQLSYIHTLNWQKAKKYVKKQEYSFSSKKERRGKIVELLGHW